jgi:hypothetical protein
LEKNITYGSQKWNMDNSDFGMRLDALNPYLSSDKSDILKCFVSDLEVHIIEQKILSRFLSEEEYPKTC